MPDWQGRRHHRRDARAIRRADPRVRQGTAPFVRAEGRRHGADHRRVLGGPPRLPPGAGQAAGNSPARGALRPGHRKHRAADGPSLPCRGLEAPAGHDAALCPPRAIRRSPPVHGWRRPVRPPAPVHGRRLPRPRGAHVPRPTSAHVPRPSPSRRPRPLPSHRRRWRPGGVPRAVPRQPHRIRDWPQRRHHQGAPRAVRRQDQDA
mmetsp:Transcript_10938/g.17533  ORF Transcript_10938/g.17533 Transcript_10938/m.17533 type:complete len:205 (-) Transcript_10938:198-812(-)